MHLFSQPPLIRFTKGTNNYDHVCIYVCTQVFDMYFEFCTSLRCVRVCRNVHEITGS